MPEVIDNTQVVEVSPADQQTQSDAKTLPQIKAVQAIHIRNPWVCFKCGAVMGSVHQDKIRQGLSVSRLILFRYAVYLTEILPENAVFGKVDAGEFGCSRCGTMREWRPGPEALRWLTEKKHTGKKNRNV